MIWKGFRFGILLQLAVGPMCLLVLSTATSRGFIPALSLVLAIALIDTSYITLAGLGIAAVLGRKRVQYVIKIFGGIILLLFGLQTILGVFDLTIIPNINVLAPPVYHNLFLQGLILTASNPLTIIFWSGVFSSQVIEHQLTKRQLFFYGMGCVLSTLIFMTGMAAVGCVIGGFLPPIIIQVLNCVVGIVIIYFGIRLIMKKVIN